jgi:hypothetical protein
MKMLSTTLQVAEDLKTNTGISKFNSALSSANPLKGANVISFLFVTSFDMYEFFKKDIGEQNIAEFLGAIGVTVAKLIIAGTAAVLILSSLVAAFTLTLSSAMVFLSIAGLSFLVGWGLDSFDTKFDIKDNVKLFLKNAFPKLTVENMIQKEIDFHEDKVNTYIGSSAMQGSGFYGF